MKIFLTHFNALFKRMSLSDIELEKIKLLNSKKGTTQKYSSKNTKIKFWGYSLCFA